MRTESGLYYGNVPSEMGEVLIRGFRQLPAFRFAMVRSIDSSRSPADIVSILSQYAIEAQLQRATVLLAPEQLYFAASRGVFAGFDEIWLLDGEQPDQGARPQIGLASDLESLKLGIPKVEACMKDFGCVVALANGVALSYATWDAALAIFIESTVQRQDRDSGPPHEP